ncbi:MAG TPA: hypothetical protein VGH45_05140 [Solirubrobacteraceae bacterium]|jgi:hypothetical protein
MRSAILIVALAFIALLATLTALDIARYGVNALDVLAIVILVLFCTGVLGALRHPPPEDH